MTETVFAKRARLFIILQETRKAKLASHKEKLLKVISLLASLAYGSCDVRELPGIMKKASRVECGRELQKCHGADQQQGLIQDRSAPVAKTEAHQVQ